MPSGLDCVVDVRVCDVNGRCQPEHQDRAEAHRAQQRERAQVQCPAHPIGERVFGNDRVDDVQPEGRHHQPEHAAERGKQRTLNEQLADDPCARCTQ